MQITQLNLTAMKKILLTTMTCFILSNGFGQSYEIVNHDYENFHDFPNNISFAEDVNANIWVLQKGGFTGDVVSLYKDEVWETIPFDECSNCTYRITSDHEGTIYLATNIGFFAYVDGSWESTSGDVISSAEVGFDSEGNVWFTSNDDPRRLTYIDQSGNVTRIDDVEGAIEEMRVSNDDKVWFHNDSQIKMYSISEGLQSFDQSADHLAVDGDNMLWFLDFGGKVGKIEGTEIMKNVLPDAVNSLQGLSLTIDRKYNLLYMGQQGTDAGIMMVNLTEGTNQFLNSNDLFPGNVALVTALFTASDGTLWAGSQFNSMIAEVQVDVVSNVVDQINEIEIYPNPAMDRITIKNQSESEMTFSILNGFGNTIDKISLPNGSHHYDLTLYTSGLYLIGNEDVGFKKIQVVR